MKHDPAQLTLSILADLTPRGDGSFVLKPRVVDSDLDTWLTVAEAGRMLGPSSRAFGRWRVRALIDQGSLISRRLSLRGTQVSLKSIMEHISKASADPDYWTKKTG